MEVPVAITVGIVFGSGLYLVMQRNLLRFVFGLVLMSGAVNVGSRTAASESVTEGPAVCVHATAATKAGTTGISTRPATPIPTATRPQPIRSSR